MNIIGGLNKDCCEAEVRSPSVLDNLQRRKLRLEKELENVNTALKALNENPKITEVLELLARV